MASYHCSVKILSRSKGRSSVQFSAYMGGQSEYDERLGETFSHTSKEEVCYNEMIFADRVPEELREQEKFWNAVESAEKSNDAQVGRTWEIALPHELTIEQNIALAKSYAESLVNKDGMPACQVSVHQKDGNWHCHIMAPTRDMNEQGKWLAKEKKEYALDPDGNRIPVIDEKTGEQKVDSRNRKQWKRVTVETNNWNSKELCQEWRERAADMQNSFLMWYDHEERVDHRSYKDRGLDKIPQIHEGYTARQMGDKSERVQYNNTVKEYNQLNEEYKQQFKLFEKLRNAFEEWKGGLSRATEIINERIRGIGERIVGRTNQQSSGPDRCDASGLSDGTIAERLDNQRASVNERIARLNQSTADRANRELERERLALEKERAIEERKRRVSHGHKR